MEMPKFKHIRDVDRVKNPYVFAMGVAAGAGVLFFTVAARLLPTNHLDLETLFGILLTGHIGPLARKIGLLAFLLVAGLSAFAYSFIFWSARRSGAGIGAQLGLIHALISGVVIGLLPQLTPGFFMLNLGFATTVAFVLAHLVYGTLVGQFFDWAALRDEFQLPVSMPKESSRFMFDS